MADIHLYKKVNNKTKKISACVYLSLVNKGMPFIMTLFKITCTSVE